ncbi:Mariner Mos1 transposase [Eumeta japonica]|uniref:Mariner Mos1 transposase n=1 Tax=Eumeta variegata TaxID=151549 RepID=A0A4C1T9B7_EUMVA|nr:Mariner Mos1 transposase [Eumeta japonica]
MRKRSWSKRKEASQKITKPELIRNKSMLCVWWDWKGIIHYELLLPDKTITWNLYRQQLMRLKKLEMLQAHKITGRRAQGTSIYDGASTAAFMNRAGGRAAGSPAVGRDNLEVADEIMDVNETKLEDMTRAEVIGHIHEYSIVTAAITSPNVTVFFVSLPRVAFDCAVIEGPSKTSVPDRVPVRASRARGEFSARCATLLYKNDDSPIISV